MHSIKTATVTLHVAHNYGSMLQAYALQKALMSLGVDNRIVNLRSSAQKSFYSDPFKSALSNVQSFVAFAVQFPICIGLHRKYILFEEFLSNHLILTDECSTMEGVESMCSGADAVIVGSDQVWNTHMSDGDASFFLPFPVKRKISYAASMGPSPDVEVTKDKYQFISDSLRDFNAISVRERGTFDKVKEICGLEPEIVVDPTMLLEPGDWQALIDSSNKVISNGNSVFWYTPWFYDEHYAIARSVADYLSCDLTASHRCSLKTLIKFPRIKYQLASGPCEFLSQIYNAKLVISGSFHAVVFSILFHKPFYAIDGDKDSRISNLLEKIGMEDRAIHKTDIADKLKHWDDLDFSTADAVIEKERIAGIDFLKKNIGLI